MTSTPPAGAEHEPLSWDSARPSAPERPSFASNLPDDTLIERPRRVGLSLVLVIVAVATLTLLNVLAAFNFDIIRDTTIAALPDDLTTDYAESDVRGAVLLLLIVVGGLGLILSLIQLASASILRMRRSSGSRAVLTVATILHLPIVFLAFALRDAGAADAGLTLGSAIVLLAAVTLVLTPKVSQWLRQNEQPRTIPLVTAEPGSPEKSAPLN